MAVFRRVLLRILGTVVAALRHRYFLYDFSVFVQPCHLGGLLGLLARFLRLLVHYPPDCHVSVFIRLRISPMAVFRRVLLRILGTVVAALRHRYFLYDFSVFVQPCHLGGLLGLFRILGLLARHHGYHHRIALRVIDGLCGLVRVLRINRFVRLVLIVH